MQFSGRVRAIKYTTELSPTETFDVIVNLAGAPVIGLPWSARRKRMIAHSRFDTTQALLQFVRRAYQPPAVWLQASAIGFYGTQSDVTVSESSPVGQGFAAKLCEQWEQLSDELEQKGIRRVVLRFGLVFGQSGGALPQMLLAYRFGAGAILGNGAQYLSWIHLDDLLRLMALAIRDETVSGKINAVAPEATTYKDFAYTVGQVLGRPILLTIPAKVLRLLLGEMASMFVDGPRIVPQRLKQLGFEYRFGQLRKALIDLT